MGTLWVGRRETWRRVPAPASPSACTHRLAADDLSAGGQALNGGRHSGGFAHRRAGGFRFLERSSITNRTTISAERQERSRAGRPRAGTGRGRGRPRLLLLVNSRKGQIVIWIVRNAGKSPWGGSPHNSPRLPVAQEEPHQLVPLGERHGAVGGHGLVVAPLPAP